MSAIIAWACPAIAQVDAPGAPPSPVDAMAAYRLLDTWVRQWRIGEHEGAATPGNPSGASVVLRLDGQVVGRGNDVSGSADTLRVAAGQALAEAAGRLPVDRDALLEQNRRVLAERITISLELAGALVPISPAEYADAAAELVPGVDGVAARFGDRVAAMFPGTMLATGMGGGSGLAAAIAKASGDPAKGLVKPAGLARDEGAVFYRFRVVHLAQTGPGEPPIFLDRGGKFFQTADLTTAELRRWADGLADNLIRRVHPGSEKYGLQGTYDPVSGKHEQDSASPSEQALALLALHSYWMRHQNTPRGDHVDAVEVRLAEAMASVEPTETAPWDDLAAAALFLSFATGGELAEKWAGDGANIIYGPVADRCRTAVNAAFSESGEFSENVALPVRPVILFGLALTGSTLVHPEEELGKLAGRLRAGVQSVYVSVPAGQLAGSMPWLGLADLLVAEGEHWGKAGSAPLGSAVALREMRALVWKHQVQPESLALEQRDLAGGIAFTATRNPAPSWQSARPLAFIATMLGDPRLTEPQEEMAELSRLLQSLRFLRQLSAGPAECHMYADPQKAMWGVRVSPWDQRMPVDATAMTLLTVCETLRSLEAIQARQK